MMIEIKSKVDKHKHLTFKLFSYRCVSFFFSRSRELTLFLHSDVNEPLICLFVCFFFHFAKLCTTSKFGLRNAVRVKNCYPCCVSCWRDSPHPCCVDEAGSCVGEDWQANARLHESLLQWAQQWMDMACSAVAGRARQSRDPTGRSDSPSTSRRFPHHSPLNFAAVSHKTCSETQNTPTEPMSQKISVVTESG